MLLHLACRFPFNRLILRRAKLRRLFSVSRLRNPLSSETESRLRKRTGDTASLVGATLLLTIACNVSTAPHEKDRRLQHLLTLVERMLETAGEGKVVRGLHSFGGGAEAAEDSRREPANP